MNERNFAFFKNFHRIMWKETLWLNFLRAFCVLPVLILFNVSQGTEASPLFYAAYPFAYIFMAAPLLILVKKMIIIISGELAGILMIIILIPLIFISIAGGDPIVFLIKKIKPTLVPVEKYPFISLDLFIFVLRDESYSPPYLHPEYTESSEEQTNIEPDIFQYSNSQQRYLSKESSKSRKSPFNLAGVLLIIFILISTSIFGKALLNVLNFSKNDLNEPKRNKILNRNPDSKILDLKNKNSRFAAIALSKSTKKYGGAWNYDSSQEAQSRAVQECGVADCRSVFVFHNTFGALAQAVDAWGSGSAKTQVQAEQIAIQNCKRFSKNPETCRITLFLNSRRGFITRKSQSPSSNSNTTNSTLPRQGILKAQQPDAKINLRSQPSRESKSRGYGLVNDNIEVLKVTQGGDGHTWYYVRFNSSRAEGWIRGDFIEFRPFPSKTHSNSFSPNLTKNSQVHINGIGPIRVGMTIDEASKSAGVRLIQIQSGSESQGCSYFKPDLGLDDVQFMVTQGRISRVDIFNEQITTFSGAKIGDSEKRVMSLYPGQIQVQPHEYVQDGHYLIFIPKDKLDQSYRVVFETDGNRVTSFRAGKIPEVTAVEGCV